MYVLIQGEKVKPMKLIEKPEDTQGSPKIPLETAAPSHVTPELLRASDLVRPKKRRMGVEAIVLGVACALMIAVVVLGIVLTATGRAPKDSAATSATSSSTTSMNMGDNPATAPTVAAPAHQAYDAQLPPVLQGDTVDVKLVMKEALITIAPGIVYHAWTFNGTVPGPIIHVRQGQLVRSTIVNEGSMAHSIDFHAAQVPWNVDYQSIEPGKSFKIGRAHV
jgi:nitrite reductase (NO-forming)